MSTVLCSATGRQGTHWTHEAREGAVQYLQYSVVDGGKFLLLLLETYCKLPLHYRQHPGEGLV